MKRVKKMRRRGEKPRDLRKPMPKERSRVIKYLACEVGFNLRDLVILWAGL